MESRTPPAVTRAYAVCCTRRCGSNCLCDWLRGAGIAGKPREHIKQLEPWQIGGFVDLERYPEVAELLGPNAPLKPLDEDLIALARTEGTGENGVFGTKIFWHNLGALARRVDLPRLEVLRLLTPELRCIHMTRRSKDRQAISNWRAMQTGAWTKDQPERREPEYHYGQIRHIERVLEQHDAYWLELFEAGGIEAHTIDYDEFVADPEGQTREALRFLGLPDNGPITPSRMRRQSDDLSEEWLTRYIRERAERGDE
jgi:trehalose 2-sulfotransferase